MMIVLHWLLCVRKINLHCTGLVNRKGTNNMSAPAMLELIYYMCRELSTYKLPRTHSERTFDQQAAHIVSNVGQCFYRTF